MRNRQMRMTGIFAAFVLSLLSSVVAQETWSMRVCASPHDYPASSRLRVGFENKIAEVLADELGAQLSFVWTPFNDLRSNVEQYLNSGACDMMMGVADGASGMLSTIAYYKAPYVFAYLKASPFELSTLADDALRGLKIATYPNSSAQRALLLQGLETNLVPYRPIVRSGGQDYATPIMRDILAKKVDVALLYGPDVSPFVKQNPDTLTLVPVSPEIAPPFFQMFRLPTIGVRPRDEALRDRLDQAISRRWQDIHAILAAYAVPDPAQPVSQPRATQTDPSIVRMGVILPSPTATPALTDATSSKAHLGALLAEDLVTLAQEGKSTQFDVLFASAPSGQAAARAGQRLVATEGVDVLIGGLGDGQAVALQGVAARRGVLFFNIGSVNPALRRQCVASTFHIEASAGMYLDALVGWFTSQGARRWHLVHEAGAGDRLYENAVKAIERSAPTNRVVGSSRVQPGTMLFYESAEEIASSSPDIVLSLIEPADNEFFVSQLAAEAPGTPIVSFPYPETQTREFAYRFAQAAGDDGDEARVALWDTRLTRDGAAGLNRRFMSSTGEPLEPAAWATYAAVQMFTEAVLEVGSTEPEALISYLESNAADFDLHKGARVNFRASDHQLQQPLYLVKTNAQRDWQPELTARVDLVQVLGQLPNLYLPATDFGGVFEQLGSADAPYCQSSL